MKTIQSFQHASSKFKDFWRGDSGEMECRRVSDYSNVSYQNLLTDGLTASLRTH